MQAPVLQAETFAKRCVGFCWCVANSSVQVCIGGAESRLVCPDPPPPPTFQRVGVTLLTFTIVHGKALLFCQGWAIVYNLDVQVVRVVHKICKLQAVWNQAACLDPTGALLYSLCCRQ